MSDNILRMPQTVIDAEDTLIIETPERIQLEFNLASIGNRFLAVLVDHFLQFFGIFLIAWFFQTVAGSGRGTSASGAGLFEDSPKWVIALMILVLFIVFSSYFIIFEWLMNGQTPGKKLMKLRVIREDGRPITIWEAVTRNLVRIADAAPGFLVPIYSVGLIAIFLSGRDQRLGDIFAGTVVIRERADDAPTFEEAFATRISDSAFVRVQKPPTITANVSSLTEKEIEVVEVFLRRRWDLTERQRIWMAWRIALPIMYRLKPAYDMADFTYEGFLEEILSLFHAKQRFLN